MMRKLLVAVSMLLCSAIPAFGQLTVNFGLPGISIGINVPVYPQLVRVPGYPVYYDPRANSNYFFYDGLYWVYQADNWYASSWYNGPWQLVGPEDVPLYLLRVPVRYYRHPPTYFGGWRADAPPRWGDHWGRDWEQRRSGWDNWDKRSVPAAAPLPLYQRQYSGNRYPQEAQQQLSIRSQNYRYQPHEAVTQQHFQQQGNVAGSRAEPQRQAPAQQRSPTPQQQPQASPQRQQQLQQQQQQPRQQSARPQPAQPVQQAQPSPQANQPQSARVPTQVQRPQNEPQAKARENKPAPQARENKPAPQARENKPAPQARESKPAPQARESKPAPQARENKPAPQDKARENKPAPQEKDRENKGDERGQDRR